MMCATVLMVRNACVRLWPTTPGNALQLVLRFTGEMTPFVVSAVVR